MVEEIIRALLIEDNPGDARLIEEIIMEVSGFSLKLEWVDRLSLGLDRLERDGIDVVILDLSLPDSSGYGTFQQLYTLFPQIPVVLLTGLEDERLGTRAVRDGAQDYLIKGEMDGNLLGRTIRYAVERKKSVEALKKSEQLFEKTFTSLIDPVFIIDAQSLEIVNCNPAASIIFGYAREEMIGRKSLFLLDSKFEIERGMTAFFDSKGSKPGEVQEKSLRRKDGSEFSAEYSYVPLEDDMDHIHNWLLLVRDISIRKQAQETLRESEERYILAVRGANDGLWDWNLKTDQIYYSPRWKSMLGYEDDEIDDHPDQWLKRVHPDDQERVMVALSSHFNGITPHFEIEHRMEHHDGVYRWMLVRGLAVRDEHGVAYRMAGSQSDITARKKAEDQLIHDAFHDLLTGLPNRALLMDRLSRTIEHTKRRPDYMFAVLFMDLDRFKIVNDSLGHAVGDELLVQISKSLKVCLRAGDTIARFGGDEFIILLEDIRNEDDAIHVANRVLKLLANPFYVGSHRIFTSSSIGIVLSTVGYIDREEVLRDADIAMYQAKTKGRAQYVMFNPEMRKRAIARLELENELRHALERGEFEIHYQPIVSLSDSKINGFEALLRWDHHDRGYISPAEFIPVAEETGLILEIGSWVLEQSCTQMRQWQEQYPHLANMRINVNISHLQLNEPGFIQIVENVLSKTGLDPACLNLEITENMLMQNAESMVEFLNQLRNLGIGLQIDDFGTGYSSLSYLQRLPIDTLKIDYSFIKRIGENGDRTEIVNTIILLAHELGIVSIAEGIETENQYERLRSMQCEFGQGFYIGKPMSSNRIVDLFDGEIKLKVPDEMMPDLESEDVSVFTLKQ